MRESLNRSVELSSALSNKYIRTSLSHCFNGRKKERNFVFRENIRLVCLYQPRRKFQLLPSKLHDRSIACERCCAIVLWLTGKKEQDRGEESKRERESNAMQRTKTYIIPSLSPACLLTYAHNKYTVQCTTHISVRIQMTTTTTHLAVDLLRRNIIVNAVHLPSIEKQYTTQNIPKWENMHLESWKRRLIKDTTQTNEMHKRTYLSSLSAEGFDVRLSRMNE